MKIIIDNQDIYELQPWQQSVLLNDLLESEFEDHMKRIARWVWEHKYENSFKRLKEEWEPKLIERGAKSLPTNPEAFATLVFSQPDYKNRTVRDAEADASRNA